MHHLDDDHRYIMIMGVGPKAATATTSPRPSRSPSSAYHDALDLKHIIQAQLGYEPDEINLRVAGIGPTSKPGRSSAAGSMMAGTRAGLPR